jgi:hypothetical protein
MPATTSELKKIVHEVLASAASAVLMKRIEMTLDQIPDTKLAANKVEKLVALFMGSDHAKTLEQRFKMALS